MEVGLLWTILGLVGGVGAWLVARTERVRSGLARLEKAFAERLKLVEERAVERHMALLADLRAVTERLAAVEASVDASPAGWMRPPHG